MTATLLLPVLTGCPGSLEATFPDAGGPVGTGGSGAGTGGAGGGGVCDAPAMVFTPVCSGCHSSTPTLMNAMASTLMTEQAVTSIGPCAGQPFVNLADRPNSVILKRLSGTTCGPLMPFLAAAPDQNIVNCVTSWIMGQ